MSCLCLNVQSDPYNFIKTIFIFLSYKIKKDIFATVPIRRCKSPLGQQRFMFTQRLRVCAAPSFKQWQLTKQSVLKCATQTVKNRHKYLFKCLQQVAAWHRECDVYMMHDEQRLLLRLIGEVGQIISDEQQHVHLNLLLGHRETERWKRSVSTSQQRASVRKRRTHKEC